MTFLAKFLHLVAELAVKSQSLVALVDFNLPFHSTETEVIKEFMATMDLSRIVECPLSVAGSS